MASSTPSVPGSSQDRVVKALDIAIGVVKFAKEAVPVELAKGVLSSVAGILSIVRDTIKNKEDFMDIIRETNEISAAIWDTATVHRANDPTFIKAIEELKSAVEKVHVAIREKTERQVVAKIITASIDKEQVSAWKEDIASALRLFFIKLNVLNTVKLVEVLKKLEEISEGQLAQFPQLGVRTAHPPPALPTYFFGRSDFVHEVVKMLCDAKHVALIGSGGMGKTSIAKAVINDEEVAKKFGDERYFIPFDNHDAPGHGNSMVTFDVFSDRIANALGLRPNNADKQKIIQSHLVILARPVLLVLDNAESIFHAGEESGRIANMIEELGARPKEEGSPPAILLFTTRSQALPNNLRYESLVVPPLALEDAFEAFTAIYKSPLDGAAVKNLLAELECHPLSINLLAHAAERNKWSEADLVERWKKEKTQVLALNTPAGKTQSLAVSLNLSLNSPSCQDINPKVSDILQIIAFLPVGADVQNLERMVPSLSESQRIVDALCQLSLTYRKGQFVTMLAPIRMHILSDKSTPISHFPLLTEVRIFYNDQISRSAPEDGPRRRSKRQTERIDGKWICTEDINVERLLAFDMGNAKETKQKVKTIHLCIAFITLLLQFKPRTTILEEHIKAITVRRPQRFFRVSLPTSTNELIFRRAFGLFFLGELAGHAVGEFKKAMDMYKDSFNAFESLGAKEGMAKTLVTQGELYQVLGDFVNAEKLFNIARKTTRNPMERGRLELSIAMLSAFMGRPNAANLAEEGRKILDALSRTLPEDQISIRMRMHPRVAQGYIAYFNSDQPSSRRHFQEALDICERVADKKILSAEDPNGEVLLGLAGVAIREGDVDEALRLLERCRKDNLDGPLGFRGVSNSLGLQASLAAEKGDFDLARSQVNQAIAVAISAGEGNMEQAVMIYTRGRIELLAGDLVKARSEFDRAIALFDALSDVRFKSRSFRALGEIAVLEKNAKEAEKFFGKAKSLCETMGIQPEFLYVCLDCFALPEKFASWQAYLNGQLRMNV